MLTAVEKRKQYLEFERDKLMSRILDLDLQGTAEEREEAMEQLDHLRLNLDAFINER